jgi:hypothetical protein
MTMICSVICSLLDAAILELGCPQRTMEQLEEAAEAGPSAPRLSTEYLKTRAGSMRNRTANHLRVVGQRASFFGGK